eukprot:jgi/Phyca11/49550/gw1.151.8.1
MHRFTKALIARGSSAAISQQLMRPQSLSRCVVFFSTESPQMGKRLTPEELAERRTKRAERRATEGKDVAKEEKSDALFIEGSVRHYHRHYVIVEPENTDPNAWPAKLERTPEHILSSYVGALMKICGGDMAKFKESPLVVTAAIPYTGICSGEPREESENPTEEGAHDILVFPDFVRIHNVVPSQIPMLVGKSLAKDLDFPALLKEENLQYTSMEKAYHMMVCGHAAR